VSGLGIRDRVTVAAGLALAAGLAVLTLAAMLLLSSRLHADAASVLHARAEAVLATLDTSRGRVDIGEPPNDESLDRDAWVFDASGHALERAPASPAAVRAAIALAAAGRGQRTVRQVRLRALAIPTRGGGRRLGTVVAGISLLPYRHTQRIALFGMVVLDLFVLIGGVLIARRAVGVALRPVAAMTAQAADWSEHDLDRRFALGPPRDELTALSATLDSLLARIGASIRHEQRLAAEVAHELKTPLSGLRGEAELALREDSDGTELRGALASVVRGTDRMSAVIDTLLTAARGHAGHGPGACDAQEALETAAAVLRPLAASRGVALALPPHSRPLEVGADADTVAQALHPLLENALRHARSVVEVSLADREGEVVFAVRDDGRGVDPVVRGHLFEPGASSGGGAGLGLPLARRLARSCGGDVENVPATAGACFELRMPATGVAAAQASASR
jgi:signal transduction histidine kinase